MHCHITGVSHCISVCEHEFRGLCFYVAGARQQTSTRFLLSNSGTKKKKQKTCCTETLKLHAKNHWGIQTIKALRRANKTGGTDRTLYYYND